MSLYPRFDIKTLSDFCGNAGLYDQRLDETQISLLYAAVQAANATQTLLRQGNSEMLAVPAPPPSSPEIASGAPVVRLHAFSCLPCLQAPLGSNSSMGIFAVHPGLGDAMLLL